MIVTLMMTMMTMMTMITMMVMMMMMMMVRMMMMMMMMVMMMMMMMMGSWPICWEVLKQLPLSHCLPGLYEIMKLFSAVGVHMVSACFNMLQLILWAHRAHIYIYMNDEVTPAFHANLLGIPGQFVIFEMWYGPSVPWTPGNVGEMIGRNSTPCLC